LEISNTDYFELKIVLDAAAIKVGFRKNLIGYFRSLPS